MGYDVHVHSGVRRKVIKATNQVNCVLFMFDTLSSTIWVALIALYVFCTKYDDHMELLNIHDNGYMYVLIFIKIQ